METLWIVGRGLAGLALLVIAGRAILKGQIGTFDQPKRSDRPFQFWFVIGLILFMVTSAFSDVLCR
ncbi:MAG: hypothetical protein ACKOQM_09680 [Novosphingobium sp.]